MRRLADEVRTSVTDAMKTLRADLAAAARDARDDAQAVGRTSPPTRTTCGCSRATGCTRPSRRCRSSAPSCAPTCAWRCRRASSSQEVVDLLTAGLRDVRRDVIAALRR